MSKFVGFNSILITGEDAIYDKLTALMTVLNLTNYSFEADIISNQNYNSVLSYKIHNILKQQGKPFLIYFNINLKINLGTYEDYEESEDKVYFSEPNKFADIIDNFEIEYINENKKRWVRDFYKKEEDAFSNVLKILKLKEERKL